MQTRQDSARGGKGQFDRQTWLLLVVNSLFIAANALSGTFLGVYLWKSSNNFAVLGWFTLLVHVSMALTFWIAGNGVKEGNKMIFLRWGIAVSGLFYAIVLLLGKQAFHYYVLLGVVQGISVGLFWLAFNVVYFEVTDADSRDRFNGWAGVIGSTAGMVAPWISGLLISRMAGESGYRVIFIVSLCIFGAGIGVSFFLRNRKTDGNYDWILTVRALRNPGTPWRRVFGALAAQGIRESVFGIMIGLLVYIQTGSEYKLGNFALVTSAVGFASFFAAGKWLKPAWRRIGMLVGTIAITAVIVPFFFGISYATLLIFGVGAALFFPLYTIPMTSAVFDLIGKDEDSAKQRVEYVVMRELALNAGRIAGMAIFLATVSVSKHPTVLNIMLLAVGSAPILSWIFMRDWLLPQHRRAGT